MKFEQPLCGKTLGGTPNVGYTGTCSLIHCLLISNLSWAQPSKLLSKCTIFHYFSPTLPYKYMFKLLLGTSTIFLCNNFLQKNINL